MSSTTKKASIGACCRSFIILACIVALPALAVFWNRLQSIDFRDATFFFGAKTTANDENETTYRTEPAKPIALQSPVSQPETPRTEPQILASFEGRNADLSSTANTLPTHPSSLPRPLQAVPPTASPISQAAFATPSSTHDGTNPFLASHPESSAIAVPGHASIASAPPIPFEVATPAAPIGSSIDPQRLHAQLGEEFKQLGAQFYRLQTWGNRGELYRFSCYVAAPGNEQYQRHFQAIGDDSIQAMRKVLDEVKTWRAGFEQR